MLKLNDDQAAGLRRLFRRTAPKVVAVVGGQAASGATRIACALAERLAAHGVMATLIDEHRSPRGAASVLDVRFRYDLWQVVNGDVPLQRAAVAVNDRLRFLSAARLAQRRDQLDEVQRSSLEQCWPHLSAGSEVVVIDANIHAGGKLSPLAAKAAVIAVVTGSGSAAVMGSYLTLKSIALALRSARLGVVVNRAADAQQAAYIGENMRGLIRQQLGRSMEFFGFAPVVSDWREGTMPTGNIGVDVAGLLSALSVPSRHDHCISHNSDSFVKPAAAWDSRTAAVAT